MKYFVCTVMLISVSLANAAEQTVFKSKDASGNTVYSDQATSEAEEIVIEAPQTFKAQPPSQLFQEKQAVEEVDTGPAYQSLKITSPEDDSAIRANAGNLTVTVTLEPDLQPNHSLQIMVDGEPRGSKKSPAPFALSNLDRGTHQLQVVIIEDESGEVIQSSNTVITTILRVSIINRAN